MVAKRKTAILILLAILFCFAALFVMTQAKESTYCDSMTHCIEVMSVWNEVAPSPNNKSIFLIKKHTKESMAVYFLEEGSVKFSSDDYRVLRQYPWGDVTKFDLDTLRAKNKFIPDLENQFFIPQWRVVIICDKIDCFDDIKGFQSSMQRDQATDLSHP